MSRNSSIISFFQRAPRPGQNPKPTSVRQEPSSPTPPPPPSPSPLPALSLSSPPAPTSAVRDRNTVIRGSDDEDEDEDGFGSDDDEFPDLFAQPPAAAQSTLPAAPPPRGASLYATPKAKRRALEFHSSPLTINTKHKFDIKALLKHAEADDAVVESEQRTDALLARGSPTARATSGADGVPDSLHDTILDVLSEPDGSQDEGNRGRLLRAVKRTEATVQRKEWHFFSCQGQGNGKAIEVRPAFPKTAAAGAWAFLRSDRHRPEIFEDGLPYHVQCRIHSLPDEIFRWVLNEALHENSRRLQEEYLRLVNVCEDQIWRVMDERLIVHMFRAVGASEASLAAASEPNGCSTQGCEPYPQHQLAGIRAVLRILAAAAHGLKLESLTRTMCILLRLGIDNIVREDQTVATEYQDALHQIAAAIPWRSWNKFCGAVGDSLYFHTQDATLRWNAVSSIPLLHPRLTELRRRLALVFVFDDPRRAFSPPEDTFSMRSVIDRLDQADEFVVDRSNTDYFELLALAEMLSVAVGDGCPPGGDAGAEAIKQYNAEVDELAQRVKLMWSNIHEQGAAYMSRLEARVQLKDFERKLQHVVRTRARPKEDIFGLRAAEDEVERPKQQQFMKRFLSENQTPPPKPLKAPTVRK